MLKLLTIGTDSNVKPLRKISRVPEALTPQCDGRMWDDGEHASIKHCINASEEAQLRFVVNVSTITDEGARLPHILLCTEPFDSITIMLDSGLLWRERGTQATCSILP